MSSQRQRVIQDGMEQMNPCVRVGLRQAKELALHRLGRIVLEVHEHKEQFVFDRWERAVAIGGVGAPNAVIALHRLGLQGVLKARRKARDEVLKLSVSQAGQGDELGLILGKVVVPEHTASF